MGRLLFPDAADAFGYQRTTPNYERTRGMDAYGPQNIAAGIAAAQGALNLAEHVGSEYVKPLAQKVAEYRMAARAKLGIPLTNPDQMKASFGGLATAAYGPEGQPALFNRQPMEPPLRQRKPIVAGGQPVSRPDEVDLQTAMLPAQAQTQAKTAAPSTTQTAPVVQQTNLNYRAQAEQDLKRNLLNEYVQLDEAAQNDSGENLQAITARMKDIESQLNRMEPRQASPFEQLGQTARLNEAALGRVGQYPTISQTPAAPAPRNEYEPQLRQMDDKSLIQMGRDARKQNRQDVYDAVKMELDRRADEETKQAVTPEQQMLDKVEQQIANGVKLTPKAQAQVQQLRQQVAQQQAQQPAQAAQQPLAEQGQLAPSTAPQGGPQAYAQKLGGQLQEFESTQQAPTYRAPAPKEERAPVLVQNPDGEWEVNVNPKRAHTVTELQALISAAGRTGRVEDMQKVQQAIMSAPMDDAPPQSWMDIFSEIGGGKGSQRESTRQQLLQQLNASMPKALSPMDRARLADIESKIGGRDQLEAVRVQQEAILREKAANEGERQRMELEKQYLTNLVKEYDAATKKFGVNSAQAKAVLAEVKAANAQREIDENITYKRSVAGSMRLGASAQMKSAKAREFHETHDMQGRGGDINIGVAKKSRDELQGEWNKLDKERNAAVQIAKDAIPNFTDLIRKYSDYDTAVKSSKGMNEAQRKALQNYYATVDSQKNIYDQMEFERSGFTKDELKYFKEKTFREDQPGKDKGF